MSKKPSKPKPTQVERELSDINTQALAHYKQQFYPQEQKFVGDVLNSQGANQAKQAGIASSATEQAFAQQKPAQMQGLAARGANLSSGAGLTAITGTANDKGLSKGQNLAQADQAVRAGYYTNLAKLVATGKGQQSNALAIGGQVATQANQQAIMDARASAAARSALNQGVGTAVGFGVGSLQPRSVLPTMPVGSQQGIQRPVPLDFNGNPDYGTPQYGVAPNPALLYGGNP